MEDKPNPDHLDPHDKLLLLLLRRLLPGSSADCGSGHCSRSPSRSFISQERPPVKEGLPLRDQPRRTSLNEVGPPDENLLQCNARRFLLCPADSRGHLRRRQKNRLLQGPRFLSLFARITPPLRPIPKRRRSSHAWLERRHRSCACSVADTQVQL